ncbi:MAG: SCP2 sterol-binding domain-containing protein [Acidimicrobiales bacterium]|jgi:putative sterol carrier protein
MSKWLSAEWFDETRAAVSSQVTFPGLSARIQCEISGGPDGNATSYWVIEDGRPVSSGGGQLAGAEVTLSMSWDDAVAMQQGRLDPSVAFMQGRMKVTGSMEVVLALLPVTASSEFRDLQGRVAELTEF